MPDNDNRGKSPGSLAALEENRQATQFGGERGNVRPPEIKPYSVRHAIRRFARLDVSLDDPSSFTKALPKQLSMAEYIAAQGLIRASKGSRDLEIVIEQIDGKVAQEFIIPSIEKAPENNKTVEEAEAAYREHISK